jgi:hypothetical protein
MATTVSKTREVDEHYWAQVAILAALVQALRDVWPNLDPSDLRSLVNVRRLIASIVPDFSAAAIATAADYYEDVRALHVPGRFNAPTLPAVEVDDVGRALIDATKATESRARLIGVDELEADLRRDLEAEAQSMVADSASDEVFHAMRADRQAKGWARITRPGACYFCRMLASRGAVYQTRQAASFRAHKPRGNGTGGLCRCTVEPVFTDPYEPTAQARADIELWREVTRDGFSGAAAIKEFRRRLEGRADGPRRD